MALLADPVFFISDHRLDEKLIEIAFLLVEIMRIFAKRFYNFTHLWVSAECTFFLNFTRCYVGKSDFAWTCDFYLQISCGNIYIRFKKYLSSWRFTTSILINGKYLMNSYKWNRIFWFCCHIENWKMFVFSSRILFRFTYGNSDFFETENCIKKYFKIFWK